MFGFRIPKGITTNGSQERAAESIWKIRGRRGSGFEMKYIFKLFLPNDVFIHRENSARCHKQKTLDNKTKDARQPYLP